ncbi:GATOR complex protein NPRL2-like isoform X1 [Argiope bruennichi]|uniref:GATOR complex protein NPRL2 like protein n=1 Tax=Argiope bruennichi TaxID=94029 RepID=A0A8T0E2V1_ARGBR|nr:GATOR complex protein NPRL2-like isoform X1 [Argiope bruennichi]KAF8764221.1 GATOR complex protein NPRL2 like protein [Argiope bruennichi]
MSRAKANIGESSIKCIFYSEFHHTTGPKITFQVPVDYVSKELFDSYVCYIIPKEELQRKLITVNARKGKIIGYPIHIENAKYPRNRLIFNLCFVCDASKRTMQYEPIVRKLANYLVKLELEDEFLFQEHTKAQLPSIMVKIREELNRTGKCSIPINASNTIFLNVIRVYPMPPQVMDQDVPIFTERKFPVPPSDWDITMQQWDLTVMLILPYIDGFRHVAKIAVEAGVEIHLVKAFIQNMVYYGVVTLIPIFMYSNVYIPTPKLNELADNCKLQEECVQYVARQGCHKPFFRSIFMLYCQLTPQTNVKTLCLRNNPRASGIDERKLIQFGLMKGIIRQLQKYPIQISSDSHVKHRSLLKYFNGHYSFEEICCKTGLSYQDLDERVEKDQHVVICWK